jgi:uncharacterized protein (TIGR00730 family)
MDETKKPLKAYRNLAFLDSPEARPLRILSEYIEPRSRLARHGVRDTIVFFGSARFVDGEAAARAAAEAATEEERLQAENLARGARYYEDARRLASMLTRWADENRQAGRHFVIASGGGPGIMEAANRGASEAGGDSVGFNIALPFEQQPNPYITPDLSFDFHYFFMRKLWLAYLGKALVAFPGGFGTMDELFELLTLVQTRKLSKQVVVLLYGREYWDRVVDFDALAEWGAISPEDLNLFEKADTPEEAFEKLTSWLAEKYFQEADL